MTRAIQRKKIPEVTKLIEVKYNPEDNPPRFSFRNLTNGSKFGYKGLEHEDKIKLINTLHTLGSLTWAQIRTLSREKSGCEIINRDSLEFSVPDSVPATSKIIAFRFSGMAAMLGYRSTFGTFYIIAFDTKFKAYDHG
jgi:hypothetical protein